LIEPGFMSASELDEVEAGPPGKWIERYRDSRPPISNVAEETSWRQCFSRSERAGQLAEIAQEHSNQQPVRSQKTGRNEPCPCRQRQKIQKMLRSMNRLLRPDLCVRVLKSSDLSTRRTP
jgi:hypothetical protein